MLVVSSTESRVKIRSTFFPAGTDNGSMCALRTADKLHASSDISETPRSLRFRDRAVVAAPTEPKAVPSKTAAPVAGIAASGAAIPPDTATIAGTKAGAANPAVRPINTPPRTPPVPIAAHRYILLLCDFFLLSFINWTELESASGSIIFANNNEVKVASNTHQGVAFPGELLLSFCGSIAEEIARVFQRYATVVNATRTSA
mmetsp:Transcript_7714/g.14011  ORF Transcript_7714/g.14011 Transcript_7714/m.14011 type:complete len:202 (-) Transcript_7714:600-1205(-)